MVQLGTTKDQGLYNKPSAAVHPEALAAGTLLHTYCHPKNNGYTIALKSTEIARKDLSVSALCNALCNAGSTGSAEVKTLNGYLQPLEYTS